MSTRRVPKTSYRDFRLSYPLDEPREVRKAVTEAVHADKLLEHAIRRTWEVYHKNRFAGGGRVRESPVVGALDEAHDALGLAREAVGNAINTSRVHSRRRESDRGQARPH